VHTHELPAPRLSSDEQEEKGPGGSSEEGRWAGGAEHVEDTVTRVVRTEYVQSGGWSDPGAPVTQHRKTGSVNTAC